MHLFSLIGRFLAGEFTSSKYLQHHLISEVVGRAQQLEATLDASHTSSFAYFKVLTISSVEVLKPLVDPRSSIV